MNEPAKNIYCISGLGADEKVFERLHINGYSLKHINWIAPLKNESLESYALRIAEQIPEHNPIILGLSFGGMLAVEIAKHIAVDKIILISAVKTCNEIPGWMRWTGVFKLNKFLPVKTNRFTKKADDRRMGNETDEEKQMVEHYRQHADQTQVSWAIDKILNWKNEWVPANVFHIHGENDKMFPIKNISATHVIKNGTHIMILNRAEEISACVEEILNNEQGTRNEE